MSDALEAAQRIVTPAAYKDGVTYLYDRDIQVVARAFLELRQAAAHLAAFDWEDMTSPASADLNARILALRALL